MEARIHLIIPGCIALVILFATVTSARRRGRSFRGFYAKKTPNIILFLTDDQDSELGSMEFMPKTLRSFRRRGTEFRNGMVTTPICCPSRSSILTGMYVHNHNVHTNAINCTGKDWKESLEPNAFGPLVRSAGYRTGYFGKYLNEYDGSYVPPGWDEWMGQIKNSRFYNYSVNFNGRRIKHGDDYHRDYFTDLITNDSIRFLYRSKRRFPRKPLLMVLSFPAPHGPEDPAPQHSSLFEDIVSHRTDSWNYAPNPDKEWLLRRTGKMEPVHVTFTDFLHRRRLQTLQSVDNAVNKVVSELRDLRELSNSYLFFTSDHGYHLGQYGLLKGKNLPYEFDIKWECRQNEIGRWRIFKCRGAVSVEKQCLCVADTEEDRNLTSTTDDEISRTKRSLDEVNVFRRYDNKLLSQWEKTTEDVAALVPKELIDQWESQFFSQIIQDVRRHLKKERPLGGGSEEQGKLCDCLDTWNFDPQQKSGVHPLKAPFKGYVSDSELLSLMQERRTRGRDRGGRRGERGSRGVRGGKGERGGRGRRGRGRKKSEKKRFCNIPNMNCFVHDPYHWATPPLWPPALGSFCFCQNSNNNSYWCLRTLNSTHNFLYCEFITGFVSFYDINKDPHQLENAIYLLPVNLLEQLSDQLQALKGCSGHEDCEKYSSSLGPPGQDAAEKVVDST